jgi:hypothetical protein
LYSFGSLTSNVCSVTTDPSWSLCVSLMVLEYWFSL